jgi:hypothetical protein
MAASTALEENFNRKLEVVTAGLLKEYLSLLNRILKEDAITVMDYMVSLNAEVNPSENSKFARHNRFSIVRYKMSRSMRDLDYEDQTLRYVGRFHLEIHNSPWPQTNS